MPTIGSLQRSRNRPASVEAKRIAGLFELNNGKSCSFQARGKGIRVDRDKSVCHVKHSHEQALQAVAADENSTGLKHSPHFAKQIILQFR